jgi:UDP-glucose 4-epimerase
MKKTKEKKNILVTGGFGFLGSHVVDSLESAGHNVIIFDSNKSANIKSGSDFINGDILDLEALTKALKNVDVVFHLAAFSDLDKAQDNPIDTMKVNVIGMTNVLEAARINKINRVIFSSSIYVSSRTGGFYRVSKHSCELLLEEYFNRFDLKYTILRFGTLYGTRSDSSNSVYNYLKDALRKGEIQAIGSGKEIREYIDVRDTADFCVEVLADKYEGETLVLTGQHRMQLAELLEMISEILDNKVNIEYGRGKNSHYKYTPYSYNPKPGKKIVLDSFRDMGQGLVEILEEIDN